MADASVMAEGLRELRDAVERLPATVERALQLTALVTAERVKDRARQLAPYDTAHHDPKRPHIRDTIAIKAEPEKKQYVVTAGGTDLPMLAVWLEYGTAKMRARPFMRPAADAESERYKSAMANAAEDAAKKALT